MQTVSYPLVPDHLYRLISSLSPSGRAPVILCIGTDRIIGDSLGPMVGTMLKSRGGGALPVYGTLEHTVNALNLREKELQIKKKHPGSLVIAVDASLGSVETIGSVYIHSGCLHPGAGVRKNLPGIGDISITGITNMESCHPYLALQTARLCTVNKMAEYICECILGVCAP